MEMIDMKITEYHHHIERVNQWGWMMGKQNKRVPQHSEKGYFRLLWRVVKRIVLHRKN
ncbi:hypothetical protein [Marininema halotolerans]|uniref:Uncharacterized protein n=1 Tax=Marininema halotolerans TaxID=1155944 RepID=A0A1I6RM59_9BACL|nr:hypothetical protein [Marininema halotolerans]SFS65821.1 hypothetical protein SAMN05444972_105203 [Marininema halotolerans]